MEGTFLVVSHDRHFITKVANKIWWIEDHQLKEYPGTYEEYQWWMSQRTSPTEIGCKKREKIKDQSQRKTNQVQISDDVEKADD